MPRARAPILGILAVRREGSWRFHGNGAYFRSLIAASRGIVVAVFTPEDLDAESMRAHVFEGGRWMRRELPLPSVVYNRVANRIAEGSPGVVAAKRFFAERRIPLFNHGFFDKWSVHQWVSRSREARRWLLPAELLGGVPRARDFITAHEQVFFKPVDGRAGEGALEVRAEGGRWRLVGSRGRPRWLASPAAVADAVVRAALGRTYMMQKGAALAVVEGCPFDLCVLAQKDGHGRWATTGIRASIAAGARAIVTHYGATFGPDYALSEAFGAKAAPRIEREVRHLGLCVAAAVERHGAPDGGGRLGELSLDVGVDRDGRPWLFEVNAKPMPASLPALRARAERRLLAYCRFLARSPGGRHGR